jgi:glycosyltransferase involved in cell wall biosynthesis
MNGGIGTAFRNLAESLASRGHNVSVVVVTGAQSNPNSGRTWQQWVDVFREKYSVSLSALGNYPKHWDDTPTKYSYDLKKARQTYEWMLPRENDWDIIHFHEWRGLGYYITESKRLGLRFLDSLLVTGTHGPDLWAHMASLKMPELKNVEPGFLERKAIERADVVISPSLYMLKWINDEMRWPVANRLVVIPNVLGSAFSGAGPRSAAKVKAKEFVFFGRLEIRKGFSVFKDAMLELIKESSNPPKITMIGKAESESLISSLPKDWTPFTNFSIEAAHRYLKGGEGRIAVVPSLVDNSPYTILECLAAGVPLIASAAGGNAELFHPDFRETNMFRPDVKPLLKIAKDAMEKGVPVAYPALEPGEVHEAWGRWHESVPTTMSPFKGRASISVIAPIEFDEDPSDEHVKDLKECLPSFSGEVVLVHSAVKEPRVKLPPKWKLVKEETGFIPYMFNNATLKATSGEILLFVDFGARPRLDVDLIVKSFGPPKVNMLVVPSYPEGNDTLAFVAIAPQSTGASSLVMGERGIRKGRSLAIRRPTFNKLSGFDEGPNVPETVISLLIKTDVARIPVYQLPDPMPAPIIPPDDPENKELNRTQINYKNRVVYYAALGRYFPQDTGYALIVADQMIDRAKRMRGDSKKEFSLNQVCLIPFGRFFLLLISVVNRARNLGTTDIGK